MKKILELAKRQAFRDWQQAAKLASESSSEIYEQLREECAAELSELTEMYSACKD